MNKQSHRPHQTRRNKTTKNDQAVRQKQHPAGRGATNQSQTIQPSLLQHALKNPQATRPETILQLQRLYGNRAANQLLERQVNSPAQNSTQAVQRLLDFEFTAEVGIVASTFRDHDKDFKTIMDDYKEYKKSKTLEEELNGLTNLIKLSGDWIVKHGQKYAERSKDRKVTDLTGLKMACLLEKDKVEYLIKMEKGQFKYITYTGSSAHRLTAGEESFAKQHKLSRAELAAIKVYTGGDYKYINPTLLGNEGWFDSSVKALAGPTTKKVDGKDVKFPSLWTNQSDQWRDDMQKSGPTAAQKQGMKAEARDHATMAQIGLSKFPDVEAITYRGMALAKEQIEREYQQGQPVSHNLFISTSYKPKTALDFANDNATGGKIGIFFTIRVKKGKDVTMFSEAKSEGEVLLLPNAKFIVNEILKPNAADNFYRITMTQTS